MFPRQNFWLEYNLDFWKQCEHPVWLGGHSKYRRLSRRGFEDYERAVSKSILHDYQDEVMFRINIPLGAEIDEVVRNITFQIKEILDRFQALKVNQ
jgi:hypothetical protein